MHSHCVVASSLVSKIDVFSLNSELEMIDDIRQWLKLCFVNSDF